MNSKTKNNSNTNLNFLIMKTEERKFAKKLFTVLMVTLFTIGGALAQDAGDFGNAADDENVSYITVGRTMPFYVEPDNYYHPDFEPVSDNITPGFTWNWGPVAEAWEWGNQLTLANQDLNYVEITANQVGDFVLNVKEQAPEEFGGCEDPEGTDITIRVVEAPEIHSFPSFLDVLEIADGETYQQCGDLEGFDASIELSGFPNFQVRWELVRQEVDEDGNPVGEAATVESGESVVGGGTSYTRVSEETFVFDADRDLVVENNRRTRYTYTITGITDLISRRSDYLLGETTWYETDPVTFAIIVNPTPQTGPIFHIPEGHGEL